MHALTTVLRPCRPTSSRRPRTPSPPTSTSPSSGPARAPRAPPRAPWACSVKGAGGHRRVSCREAFGGSAVNESEEGAWVGRASGIGAVLSIAQDAFSGCVPGGGRLPAGRRRRRRTSSAASRGSRRRRRRRAPGSATARRRMRSQKHSEPIGSTQKPLEAPRSHQKPPALHRCS